MTEQISPALARRIALAAQGFGRAAPASVGTRQLGGVISRLGLLQIDSVTVFERSHYLPVFARLGTYDRSALDALTFARGGRYLEYWAHEAAILPIADWPLFRWRMAAHRAKDLADADGWAANNGAMLDWLRAELAEQGPLRASAIEHDANVRRGPWWGWSDVKRGLEYLFRWGEVVTAGRTRFERSYALASQVLPAGILDHEITEEDAIRELVRRSAVAHGIGTIGDLADYYRIRIAPTARAVQDLVDAGELLPVSVPGWGRGGAAGAAHLHAGARRPRTMSADALLSPFDPVVWERARAERMFGFRYRIEIYTPAPQRVHGYYVLPVLLDDRLAARTDLKSDRKEGVLRVQASWLEESAAADGAEVASRVAALVRSAASWQGLDRVEVVDRGTLAAALRAEIGAS